MPGHKRRVPPAPGLSCYAFDLTEIDGADDLHGAQGILAAAMGRTAALYGSARCRYLVGGSTVGLLAGIRALAPFGSQVIVARNCHKAVYHALELGHLTAHYLTPPVLPGFGVYGSVRPAAVAAALDACPAARCVILTSPTYEGVQSDLAAIAGLCHARGVPLLVDEAHGAHYLPLAGPFGWRGGAVAAGADLVVQSAHKTLPSLTQTAWLHLNGSLVDPAAVDRELDVFETSSPSYPLLVSLDGCTAWLAEQGPAAFAAWRARLGRFYAAARRWQNIPVLGISPDRDACFGYDDGKILLRIGQAGAAALRDAGFEPEMVCGPNVLAMTSPCDGEEALDRLADALGRWDAAAPPPPAAAAILPPPGPAELSIGQALLRPRQTVPLAGAVGRIAAEYVWAYPPGVPLLAPGERVTPAFTEAAARLGALGTALRHSAGGGDGTLAVLA
ncbi:MAG TPA: ornithine decarboxylase [Candidatus Gemmiger avium]|nr:ornithine decarboxylase [Candidatus Gemmiger avium]